jgi:hypothetical protein
MSLLRVGHKLLPYGILKMVRYVVTLDCASFCRKKGKKERIGE